jgi:hypothetical protein
VRGKTPSVSNDEHHDRLGFRSAVSNSFAFLKEHGFRATDETHGVEYTSRHVAVLIYYEPYSYEMGVRVSLPKTGQDAELSDIAEYGGAPEKEAFRQWTLFQTSNAEGVQHLVPEMARLLRTYGQPFLAGDAAAYETVQRARAAARADLLANWKMQEVRSKADAAWHERRYPDVVKFYGSVRDRLTPAELKKLQYAERKASSAIGDE